MQEKLAIGVDVGHGESAACCVVLRDGNGDLVVNPAIQPLNVKNNTPKVFSTLTYRNGVACIGEMQGDVHAYFKRSPIEWDKTDPNSGKTYREMMKDFIGTLVENLLAGGINPIIANYKKNDIALFVGCPSDETWMAPDSIAAYEDLIREATGIRSVNVVAESTAAIFSIIRNNSTKTINPKDGIAVFDFGSSTADYTYVSLGKVLAEISWTLGASSLEANIVEKVLYDEVGLDPNAVWQGDFTGKQLNARQFIKEAWYGDTATPGYSVTAPEGTPLTVQYTPCDPFGNPVTSRNKSGTEIRQISVAPFSLNTKFMEDVVRKMPVRGVQSKGELVAPKQDSSWYELCRQFFTKCDHFMSNHHLPCKTIILTGGASRMDFVETICKDVFQNRVTIYRDEYPSYCVCNGLCQIAINKGRIDDVISDEKKTVRSDADAALATFQIHLQDQITDYIFDSMIQVLRTLRDGTTVADFQKKVENYFSVNFNAQTIDALVKDPLLIMNSSVAASVVNASLRAAQGFYNAAEIDGNSFAVNMDMMQEFHMDGITIHDTVIKPGQLAGTLTHVLGQVGGILAAGVVLLALSGVPVIGPIVAALAWVAVKQWIVDNPNQKINNVQRTVNRLNNHETQIKQNIYNSAAKDCADKIVAELFDTGNDSYHKGVDDMVDKAVRIVALEHFEKRITG